MVEHCSICGETETYHRRYLDWRKDEHRFTQWEPAAPAAPEHEHVIIGTERAGHCIYCDARFPGREVQYLKREPVAPAAEAELLARAIVSDLEPHIASGEIAVAVQIMLSYIDQLARAEHEVKTLRELLNQAVSVVNTAVSLANVVTTRRAHLDPDLGRICDEGNAWLAETEAVLAKGSE